MKREAWSEIKNERYGVSYPDHFEQFRDDFRDAETDLDLFRAITLFSNARNDRHLDVDPVKHGLDVDLDSDERSIPLAFEAGFANERANYFVAGIGKEFFAGFAGQQPAIGDTLVSVNGLSLEEYAALVRPYSAHSTENTSGRGQRAGFGTRNVLWPEVLQTDRYALVLRRKDGTQYSINLPFIKFDRSDAAVCCLSPVRPMPTLVSPRCSISTHSTFIVLMMQAKKC